MAATLIPDHNWLNDPLAIALINSIAERHPVPIRVQTSSFSALYEKANDVTYDDGRVDLLVKIREQYGERCLAYSDADYAKNKHVFAAWTKLPPADTLTAIICGHWYYDPTNQWTAFEREWLESRKVAA